MNERTAIQREILEIIEEVWVAKPEMTLGNLLIDILQPPARIEPLRELTDEFLLWSLDSYLSVVRLQAQVERRPTSACS